MSPVCLLGESLASTLRVAKAVCMRLSALELSKYLVRRGYSSIPY
jgi:hypothetical protein